MPATGRPPFPPARSADRRARQVPAVTRAVAILRLLGKSDEPVGVNAIARALGLVPSTCLHILRALVSEGLVAVDPDTKRYGLDAGILTLARSVMRRNGFADVVQPVLDELSQRHAVTAIGVQVVGLKHMVVVAISRSDLPLRIHVDIGSRFPALISATGRCFAAFGDHGWAALEKQFHKLRWDHPPAFAAWRAEVEQARARGYAVDAGAYIRGVTIVAIPILDHAALMTHSIVAVGVSEQMARVGIAELAGEMRTLGAGVAERLGGH
ncbi:MAG: IclR family transcriptional regulator [Alphaproteobacteria bacterium]|nr:IclR family transcriptional regulator [Alphaproteobacteria bacterium]